MHYPISAHKHAEPAAIASECADRQGKFAEFYKTVFEQQDAFGEKSWSTFAEEAGIRDLVAFEQCVRFPADSFPRIAAGLAEGRRANVTATPTLWMNEWRVPNGNGVPSYFAAVLAGKKPKR
jgi:protein-disulfide isomerase